MRSDAAAADAVRVALVCPYDLSRPGGVQGQVLGLARALAGAGHEPTVVAPCGDPSALPAGAEPPVPVVPLGKAVGIPANGSVAPVSLSPLAALRGLRAVRRGGFDVVHLHEPLAPGAGLACLLRGDLPTVGTFHRSGDSLAYQVLAPLARRAAARLTVRCAVSDEAAATARRALGGTYEVVGNGVDLERFAAAAPWPTTGPTVLFVGRHEARKGLDVLLDAMAGAGAGWHGPRPTVWVVGTGPDSDALRRRHPPGGQVQWLGRVDDDELARRLAGAHVVCAPSLGGESFGVVLLEAMAARSVVVASDIPGYAAVVGGHGVLVPPGDVAALAAALTTALADAVAGVGRGAPEALDAAFAHASQWSMPAVAARYVAIYRRAVAPGSGA